MNISNISSVGAEPKYTGKSELRVSSEQVQVAPLMQSEPVKMLGKNDESIYEAPVQNLDEEEVMENALKQANKSLAVANRYIEREVHEKTHAVMYKIKDVITGEVIAEFPPKKIQDMVAKMWELAGLFVDEKA